MINELGGTWTRLEDIKRGKGVAEFDGKWILWQDRKEWDFIIDPLFVLKKSLKWRRSFEAEQQGRGRQERRGGAELDGWKHLLKCKILQLHFETEKEGVGSSEEIFWIWFRIAIAVERVIKSRDVERTHDEKGLGKDWKREKM